MALQPPMTPRARKISAFLQGLIGIILFHLSGIMDGMVWWRQWLFVGAVYVTAFAAIERDKSL